MTETSAEDDSIANVLLWAIFVNRKDVAEICWLRGKDHLCEKLWYVYYYLSVYQLECQWAFLTSLCMSFVRLYIRMCIYRIFNFVWLSDLVPWSVPINHRLKSVRFSVRPFALPSVCLSVNFHFWFLLYLGENNSNCTKRALIIFINIFKLNLIKN